jgi:hypothetical protein
MNNQNMNAAGIQNITLLQQQIAETLKRQEELLAQQMAKAGISQSHLPGLAHGN